MSPTVEAAGVELAYRERGKGRAVLLVHGMADDATAWDEVVDTLHRRARLIAYDRRGYGASGAPDPYERTTVAEQAEDAAALLRALDAAPALVCGRDLGALVCLDLVTRHRGLVRAAVVIDPPLYPLVAGATEALAEERLRLEEALRSGGPATAVAEFVGGARAGEERLARATAAPAAFFADYGGLASWPVSRRGLRLLDIPLTVLTSAGAPPHAAQAADALAALVPGARRVHGQPPSDALADRLA
ncbi:MAG: alpha/beta fold hydrolase [Solirubrobacteraceae bacterium]|jgi:pimeloyl-ACP methyl ester carboxylesterase